MEFISPFSHFFLLASLPPKHFVCSHVFNESFPEVSVRGVLAEDVELALLVDDTGGARVTGGGDHSLLIHPQDLGRLLGLGRPPRLGRLIAVLSTLNDKSTIFIWKINIIFIFFPNVNSKGAVQWKTYKTIKMPKSIKYKT